MVIQLRSLASRRRGDSADEHQVQQAPGAHTISAREQSLLDLQQSAGNAATTALVEQLAGDSEQSGLPFSESDLRTRCLDASVADTLDEQQLAQAVDLANRAVANADEPAEQQTARQNQLIFEVAMRGRPVEAADGSAGERAAAIEALVDFSRSQVDALGPQIEQFRQQAEPTVQEKVRVLGQLAAAVGRMEFLLGSMLYRGGDWEERSNRGAMVDDYTGGSATQWCSLFTSTMWQRITGRNMRAASGYKLANPADFGLDITYDAAAGGAFVGSRSTRSARAGTGRNHNPWAQLRQTLIDIDGGEIPDQTRAEAVEAFLTSHQLQPQAGDIMVVKRGSADANSFTRGARVEGRMRGAFQSHTTMVESFSGCVVSTIEGNADDRVRGRTYDLSNPDDVAKIVFLARPGIQPSPEAAAATEAAGASAAADLADAESAASSQISAGDLLGPLQTLNALLHRLATVVGGVEADSSAADTVHGLSPTADSGRAN